MMRQRTHKLSKGAEASTDRGCRGLGELGEHEDSEVVKFDAERRYKAGNRKLVSDWKLGWKVVH